MGIQVEELTRGLMPWQKEYIDFSFAGRRLSDFGLVAVTCGDRYNFAASPEFEDETTSVNGVWGQYYWGTKFKTRTYSYSLATDGMTERQFEDFKKHFKPGFYGQFYEDAWFDRYCYVRLKSVADFSFIPFQEDVEVAGVRFPSRIYKGECKLTFIQDRPFQYSFYQVLESKIKDLNTSNDNGKAAIRMMYHSNIPAADSWTKKVKCSTGSPFSLPAFGSQAEEDATTPIFEKGSYISYYNPSLVDTENILSFTLNRSISNINLDKWKPVYFNEINNDYTNKKKPYNQISTTNSLSIVTPINENTLKIHEKTFKYTLPEICSEVNKAINIAWIFYQENIKGALVDLQKRFQEEMINGEVLFWTIKVLQKIQSNYALYTADEKIIDKKMYQAENADFIEELDENLLGTIYFNAGDYEQNKITEEDYVGCLRDGKVTVYPFFLGGEPIEVDWFGYFNIMMLMMFADFHRPDVDIMEEENFDSFYPYRLKFNSEEGSATISYKINFINDNEMMNFSEIQEENCSNIIYSDYLKLDGGDTINLKTGKVSSFHLLCFEKEEGHPLEVENIKLEYKYTYV